jgi:hypothetical protein
MVKIHLQKVLKFQLKNKEKYHRLVEYEVQWHVE